MRYLLSKIVPVPMSSHYRVAVPGRGLDVSIPQHSTWWQWRGRIFRWKVDGRSKP